MENEEGLVYRTSRISYIQNYFISISVFIILMLIFPMLNIFGNLFHLALILILLAIMAGMAEEPEWERILKGYIVTNNEIIKVEGLFTKKKTLIPYQSVADIKVVKTLLGRILNYGTVYVSGFKTGGDIEFRGMRNPEEVHKIIQNKISLLREAQVKKFSRQREKE